MRNARIVVRGMDDFQQQRLSLWGRRHFGAACGGKTAIGHALVLIFLPGGTPMEHIQ